MVGTDAAPVIHRLEELIAEPTRNFGTIISMTYDEAIVATTDAQVRNAGGIPQRCFLIAVPTPEEEGGEVDELVLLSVKTVVPLESARAFTTLREELALASEHSPDFRTRRNLEQLAFSCSIVGTFYKTEEGFYRFGGDIDRVRAHTLFKVYRPRGRSLSLTASYSHGSAAGGSMDDALDLGVVRYSETSRMPDPDARVFVNIEDFIGKKTAVFGMSRTGKALTADTKIPVPVSSKFPAGWALNKDLAVGDQVFSSAGKPVKIVSLTEWNTEAVFEVEFADGQVVKTAGSHLWSAHNMTRFNTRTKPTSKALATKRAKTVKVEGLLKLASMFDSTSYIELSTLSELSGLTFGQLKAAARDARIEAHLGVSHGKYGELPKLVRTENKLYPVAELLAAAAKRIAARGIPRAGSLPVTSLVTSAELAADTLPGDSKWAVDVCSLDLPEATLPIDPYVLGYWLGDGTSKSGDIAVDDKPHAWSLAGESDRDSLLRQLTQAGYSYKLYPHAPMRVHVDKLYSKLRLAGLLGNKHIPLEYLRSSPAQRQALLQGLMDSDGSAGKSGAQGLGFSNATLANDALELIRSLGIRVSMSKKPSGYTHRETRERVTCKTSYSMTFDTDKPVFRLPRKLARQESRRGHRQDWNRVVAVREVEAAPVRCLTVDSPDSLHLVEGFVPTHNSNTMKTVIQKTFQYTRQPGKRPVGQLIFDPQGEYANVNSQDDFNALANIGNDDEVAIYRMLGGKNESAKERHLQFNLFAEENLDLTWNLMAGELRSGISGESNYIQPLFELSFNRPGEGANQDAWGAFKRKQLSLYALMGRSRFHSEVKDFNLYVGKELATRIVDAVKEVELTDGKTDSVTISSTYASVEVFEWLIDQYSKQNRWWREADGCPEFLDRDLKDGLMYEIGRQFAQMDEGRNGVMGAFNRIKPLHSTNAQGDVRAKIWRDLEAGKLIIVDLSKGSQRTTTTLSEMIVRYLVNEASKIFTSGQPTVPFQIVVEEAHNLFQREGQRDSGMDPWVRLSKEAAKYSIGLLYATQEVTGVDPQILSNTANWLVGHLNSRTELNELAKYYSFGDWSDHLLKVEAKGFVRMKTESSPYIVPVQIDKFIANSTGTHLPMLRVIPDKAPEVVDLPSAQEKPLAKPGPRAGTPPMNEPSAYTDDEIENLF